MIVICRHKYGLRHWIFSNRADAILSKRKTLAKVRHSKLEREMKKLSHEMNRTIKSIQYADR